jgi:hypothetical protein
MAFKMNGSPLNKGLNLFRKGRGKDYRQTKRAIKRAVKETGGFSATEREGGGYDIVGRTGSQVPGKQTGKSRRRLARSAAEAMTAGIDDKTAIAGADAGTRRFEGGTYDDKEVTKRKKTITPGIEDAGDNVDVTKRKVKKERGWGWAGQGTQEGIKTERVENIKGTSHEDVDRQRQALIASLNANEKVSMKSSAFKMKYSPFNQGYGSPLNWNEGGASPLNNLKAHAQAGGSPLNQDDKESCKPPMVWHEGHCMTEKAYRKTVTEDDGITTTAIEQDLVKKGEEGTEERKKITAAEGCEKHRFEDCCNADGSRKNSSAKCKECQTCAVAKTKKELGETKNKTCVEQHGAGYVWDAEKKDCVKGEKGTEDIEATIKSKESETDVTITKEECNKKEGFTWRDGACKKTDGDADYTVTEKGGDVKKRCKKPAAGCDEDKRWSKADCKCVPKISDERQKKLDEKESNKQKKKSAKENRKTNKDKKDCKCLEWDCE